MLSVVCQACFSVLSEAKSEKCCRRTSPENCDICSLAASNYAGSLFSLKRFEEVKSLLRRTTPVARRILGDSKETTLRMRWTYAGALCDDDGATLDDLREAVARLEDTERTARRVLGGAHPLVWPIDSTLQYARAVLRARESGTS